MSKNQLTDQTSLYLVLHADNPAQWDARENIATYLAKQQDKHILNKSNLHLESH